MFTCWATTRLSWFYKPRADPFQPGPSSAPPTLTFPMAQLGLRAWIRNCLMSGHETALGTVREAGVCLWTPVPALERKGVRSLLPKQEVLLVTCMCKSGIPPQGRDLVLRQTAGEVEAGCKPPPTQAMTWSQNLQNKL